MSNDVSEFYNVGVRQNTSLDFDNFSGGAKGGRNFLGGNQPNSIITQEGVTIFVVKGNICDQMVDALANSIGGHFNLSEGAIAKSILQRAGPKIQEELNQVKPKSPRYGDIVVTKGHKLNVTFVFHGILKKWNRGQDDAEQVLRKFIENVLMAADSRKLTRVAIPAVGTGLLGFSGDLAATCLFEECDKFSSKNPNTSVSEVRLVIYEKDTATFNAFESKMAQLQGPAGNYDDGDNDSDDNSSNQSGDDSSDSDQFSNSAVAAAGGLLEYLIKELAVAAQEEKPAIQALGLTHPQNWEPPDPCDPYRRITLSSGDQEYKAVVQNVRATAGSSVHQIVKVERIENHNLWQLYMVTRDNMVKANGKGVNNERLLWHGTCIDALTNIYAGGFNRSYCGKNATAYGKGVYFAKDFSYSAQRTYAPPDPSGTKYVFQCRVLTGQFAVGTSDMIEPPVRSGKVRYDSVTNDVNNPQIFVVFKDTHAYPEYLVSFH